ncbi:uncharacterized protein F4807DRAFT_459888 [Annulohypoxylon truncatum]|uniref:uncharacterized protein n=1 Tax=Annulohypoxylon truncatum TaxID=327061 RepID=UPI002008C087|nr:uncharacterized protein F4807DRAFT_459888 [Annulohypoxylon truncatum]KAI1210055.1 hypothetical protein F4807DRAFT_459888 [Annulohypoxylon truncatum]
MSSQSTTSGAQTSGSKSGNQGNTNQGTSSSTTSGSSSGYTDSSQRPNTLTGKPPGKRCPTCRAKGYEVWVFSGKDCGYCGTYID